MEKRRVNSLGAHDWMAEALESSLKARTIKSSENMNETSRIVRITALPKGAGFLIQTVPHLSADQAQDQAPPAPPENPLPSDEK